MDPRNVLEALQRWAQVPKHRREFVLYTMCESIQACGRLVDDAAKRGFTELASNYRTNLQALELGATLLGFSSGEGEEEPAPKPTTDRSGSEERERWIAAVRDAYRNEARGREKATPEKRKLFDASMVTLAELFELMGVEDPEVKL